MSAMQMGRAFSPESIYGPSTQGVALGWYGNGPLALRIRQTRPRRRDVPFFRANGAPPYQPGATPQELNRPIKQRAEGPNQRIAGYEGGHQFRDVTKMVAPGTTQPMP